MYAHEKIEMYMGFRNRDTYSCMHMHELKMLFISKACICDVYHCMAPVCFVFLYIVLMHRYALVIAHGFLFGLRGSLTQLSRSNTTVRACRYRTRASVLESNHLLCRQS